MKDGSGIRYVGQASPAGLPATQTHCAAMTRGNVPWLQYTERLSKNRVNVMVSSVEPCFRVVLRPAQDDRTLFF